MSRAPARVRIVRRRAAVRPAVVVALLVLAAALGYSLGAGAR